MRLTSLLDTSGAFGTVIAAMGCASCFPAIASLGASLGLGFLGQYEGIFINTLLPVFASIALAANVLSFISHRIWYRLLAGIAGPSMVLATLYLFWTDNWSTYMFYAGLAVMLAVSIWDMVSPPRKVCVSCNSILVEDAQHD
jgi:mercuric ion transport protein